MRGGRWTAALGMLAALVLAGSACTGTESGNPAVDGPPVATPTVPPSDVGTPGLVAVPEPEPEPVVTPTVVASPTDGGPPPRRHLVATDPEGDVGSSLPGHWLAGDVDLTSVEASYRPASATVLLRIGFADLQGLESRRAPYSQRIVVSGELTAQLVFSRRTSRPDSLSSMRMAPLLHFGSITRPCRRARTAVDIDADVVELEFPLRCFTDQRSVRLWITSGGERVEEHGDVAVVEEPAISAYDELRVERPLRTR